MPNVFEYPSNMIKFVWLHQNKDNNVKKMWPGPICIEYDDEGSETLSGPAVTLCLFLW